MQNLNVSENSCPDHTHSTDTLSTAASLLVNNMKKRVRDKILLTPQIYEQERRKMLTTDLGAAPGDIAKHLKLFKGVRSQLYRQRRYLIPQTPAAARNIRFGDEWCTTTTGDNFIFIDDITEVGSRVIVFGTLANLHFGWHIQSVSSFFLPALHHPLSLLQYSASRTFLSITRYTDNNTSPYIHPDTIEVYTSRSPDSSQSIHYHCRF